MSTSEAATKLDVITVEVVKNALGAIAQEMQVTLERSAYSQGIREVGDASSSLFDRHGQLVAQAVSIPVQLAGSGVAVKEILMRYSTDEMREGDVFGLNHAFCGGSHPPDIILVKPCYFEGEMVGFGCSYAHHSDLGGMSPGSTPPLSTEIYQEGLLIPPMRFVEVGVLNETLFSILRANIRSPDTMMGDMRAQLASLACGEQRLAETLGRFGKDIVLRSIDDLIERTRVACCRLISAIPDGTYEFEDVLDDDGLDLDRPIPIRVAIIVRGDNMTLDFAGTSPQVRGSLNSPVANSLSASYAAVKIFLDPHDEIPNNEGCYAPVDILLPPGSLLNPDMPASVSSRPETQARLSNVIMGALAQALPDRAVAQDHGQVAVYRMSGTNPLTGKHFMKSEPLPGGWGGRATSDGPDVVDFPVANLSNTPIEALETDFPIRIERYELRTGSGGEGRQRGGLGLRREISPLVPVTLSVRAERHKFPPKGVFGGGDGQTGAFIIKRADGTVEHRLCKEAGITMEPGDTLVVLTPGGGGYGPAAERDPEDIERDTRQGKLDRCDGDVGPV